ncbi:unnamed protein product [Cylindrotheca closterium]|uniref:Uncharacterized protein n=1 Tax=Cylindrotheca closterium TaxID=2856 RepID=A0AAD2G9P6_9STRA|nr:unnamed protein product [Cylindrotheca closterium]
MSFHFGEPTQRNDRRKRRRRSFVDHAMTVTVSDEQQSQHHPNQLSLTYSSQSPTLLSTGAQNLSISIPTASFDDTHFPEGCTPIHRGQHKPSVKEAVVSYHGGLAQQLNKEGVQCIHRGLYEEAVSKIARAIQLFHSDGDLSNRSSISLGAILNHHFQQPSPGSSTPSLTETNPDDIDDRNDVETSRERDVSDDTDGDFVYSSGIMLPSKFQSHATGETLLVVLSFNLALAHHLSWTTREAASDTLRLSHMVQLYELAYRLAFQIQANSSDDDISPEFSEICNMRFTLIIINNLSQIYQALNGEDNYHRVLEGLLSHLMVVAVVQQQHSRFATADRNRGGVDRYGAASIAINLDGFFQNVLPLLLKRNSAGAA